MAEDDDMKMGTSTSGLKSHVMSLGFSPGAVACCRRVLGREVR